MTMSTTQRSARRVVVAAAAAGLLGAAPAPASSIDLSAPPPRPDAIVMPRQVTQLLPDGGPARPIRVTFSGPRKDTRHRAARHASCRDLRGRALRRCRARHGARAATTDGLHYISPSAVCSSGGVTFDYRDFWVSSRFSDKELLAVQDFAYYWDGHRWKLYAQDQMAYAWSGYQLAIGWSTVGADGAWVGAALGDGVSFGTARGAAIRIAQFIGWFDGSGREIAQSFDWLGHMNPGWFDFASHPFCQY